MATNEELSALSGGIQGFASGLFGQLDKDKEREDAQAKWAAYQELQREMMGNKRVSGQELRDYATTLLGLKDDDPRLATVDPAKDYSLELGKNWINNLANLKITDKKQAGANERADKKANATKKEPSPKTFKPEEVSKKVLDDLITRKGYKSGTPITAIAKASDLEDFRKQYPIAMEAAIKTAGQEENIEADVPFEMEDAGSFWSRPKIKVLTGYRVKQKAQAQQPAPGMAPTPAPMAPVAPGAARSVDPAQFRRK